MPVAIVKPTVRIVANSPDMSPMICLVDKNPKIAPPKQAMGNTLKTSNFINHFSLYTLSSTGKRLLYRKVE